MVWWAEREKWVWVMLADPDGRLVFDLNPVYDQTKHIDHSFGMAIVARRKRARVASGTPVRRLLQKIGAPEGAPEEDSEE